MTGITGSDLKAARKRIRAAGRERRKAEAQQRKAARAALSAKNKKDRLDRCINRCQASHDRVPKRALTKAQLIAMA